MIQVGRMFGGAMGASVLRDVGTFAVGLAGTAGAFDAQHPRNRNYLHEIEDTLNAQEVVAPRVLGLEQQYQPKYNELALENLIGTLLGKNARGTASEKGLFELLSSVIAPALRQEQSKDRAADVSDLETLSPRVREATAAYNPEVAELIGLLTGNAKANLEGGIGAGERRELQQAIRGAQSSRGVGYGPADTFEEVYGVGREARDMAEGRAGRAIAASQSFYGNPLGFLGQRGGIGSAAAGSAISMPGQVTGSSGPSLFSPESSYAAGIHGQNYQGELATRLQNAQLRAGYNEMTAAGGDSIFKAIMGGFGGVPI